MSHFYGLKPADLDTMTTEEVGEYLSQLDEYEREIKKKAEEVTRGR